MNPQTTIYLLAALGWAAVIITRLRLRETTVQEWFAENAWGLAASVVAGATIMLIGPGDNVDLSSYIARTWAAGIGAGASYLISGNIQPASSMNRKRDMRAHEAGK